MSVKLPPDDSPCPKSIICAFDLLGRISKQMEPELDSPEAEDQTGPEIKVSTCFLDCLSINFFHHNGLFSDERHREVPQNYIYKVLLNWKLKETLPSKWPNWCSLDFTKLISFACADRRTSLIKYLFRILTLKDQKPFRGILHFSSCIFDM